MTTPGSAVLVEALRRGEDGAWEQLIDLYDGRLLAFVRGRIRDIYAAQDIVQETFLGFLRSLPHFDSTRNLENYLFTIATHKIRDHLRKEGRHPLGLISDSSKTSTTSEPAARIRGPSSLLASAERIAGEEQRLSIALQELIHEWQRSGDYRRIKCIEMLFVLGTPNREVAATLGLTEQQVANYKFQVVERLARKAR